MKGCLERAHEVSRYQLCGRADRQRSDRHGCMGERLELTLTSGATFPIDVAPLHEDVLNDKEVHSSVAKSTN